MRRMNETSASFGSTRRGIAAAILVAASMVWSAQKADAQICTAALDVDVHYCLNGNGCGGPPPAGTDTLDLQVGDPVTITLEVTNDSQFQSDPAAPLNDPPGGRLQGTVPAPLGGQAVFEIHYACTTSLCAAGQVLTNVFTFNSATVLADAGGNASFMDVPGTGTGLLTITNAGVPYASGDLNGKFLVQINLTVANKPAVNTIFARGEGNPPAFLIDDPQANPGDTAWCLAGLTGTGEGSTVAVFGGGGDLEPCWHPNKQVILIDKTAGLEDVDHRVAFRKSPYDPSVETLTFGYEHLGAPVFNFPTIPAGCFKLVAAPLLTYKFDPAPAQCQGLGIQGSETKLQLIAPPDKWCLDFNAVANFNTLLPTDKMMQMTVTTAGMSFAGPPNATWKTLPPNFVPPQLARQWYLPTSAW